MALNQAQPLSGGRRQRLLRYPALTRGSRVLVLVRGRAVRPRIRLYRITSFQRNVSILFPFTTLTGEIFKPFAP